MLLCIDIGNTNITFGLYEEETLGPRWRIRTIHEKMPDEYGISWSSRMPYSSGIFAQSMRKCPTSTASCWTNCSATGGTGPSR